MTTARREYRVLLADPSAYRRWELTSLLEDAGCYVVAALADGAAARRVSESVAVDLALIGEETPGSDVDELARIVGRSGQVPVFLLKAGRVLDVGHVGEVRGSDTALERPRSVADLHAVLRTAFGARHANATGPALLGAA